MFFFSVASVTESKSLYISRAAGNDAWSCDQWKPCKTISRTIKLATSGDQILLDGTDTDKDPYNCLSGESQYPGIYINESLSLIGSANPMPQIQCSEGTGFIFNGSNSAEQMNITISGLVLHETFLRIQDSSLDIDGCRFEDSSQGVEIAVSTMNVMNIKITGSTFSRSNNCISVVVDSQSNSSHNTQVMFKLTNSSFDGNVLADEGKVISFIELLSSKKSITSTIVLENVRFSKNKFHSKGLVWFDTKKASQFIQLQNVTFIENSPFSDQDFLVGRYSESIVNGSDVTLLINSSNFKSQHSRSFSVTAFNISVEIYNSKFAGHRVFGSGGVISVRGNNLEMFKVYNSIFVNTTAGQGGAVSIECSSVCKVSFKDGTFINNTARNGEGGAVYICSSGSSYKTSQGSTDDSDNVEYSIQKDTLLRVSVTKCNFLNAKSSVGGGGFQIRAAKALISLRHSEFINCFSNPLIFRREGTLVDKHLTSLPKRKPRYDLGEDCRGARKGSGDAGGGAFSVLVEIEIDSNIINSSFVSNSGGAVTLYTSFICSTNNNSVIKVKDSVFLFNYNSGTAPLDMIFFQNTTVILENVTMESNSGGINGAAAISENVILSIRQSQFLKNSGLLGGALVVIANKLEVYDSVFDSNCGWTDILDPWLHSGALLLTNPDNQPFAIKISKTTFKNCSAEMGGAVTIYVKTTANIQIEGSRFAQNSVFKTKNSLAGGGAVTLWSANDDDSEEFWSRKSYNGKLLRPWDYKRYVLFENTTFEKNTAGVGGAIYFKNGKGTFRNCSFLDNFATNLGGHLYVETGHAALNMQNTVFNQTINEVQILGETYTMGSFIHAEGLGEFIFHNTTMYANINNRYNKSRQDPFFLVRNGRLIDFGDNNLTRSRFYCPLGMKMDFTNFATCDPISGSCSNEEKVHYSQCECLTCPAGQYSLQRGGTFGNELIPGFHCLPCPFGANCSQNIIAKPNFWGFKEKITPPALKFTMCPLSYCRPPSGADLTMEFNGCQGNRSGELCGQCSRAYSETLYSTNCRPSKECNDYWFWPVVLLYLMFMALYVTFKPPLMPCIKRQILWFKKYEAANEEGNYDRGYLKIVFYLYQAGDLVLVSNSSERILNTEFMEPIVGLFNFRQTFSSSGLVCPFPGLTVVTKRLFSASQVFGTCLMIGLIYMVQCGVQKVRGQGAPSVGPYVGGILQIMLLGYTTLAAVSFDLLRCVPIGSEKRLFYDGNVECFQWWQYILIVFICVLFVPFVVVMLWGPVKLFRGTISVGKFLLACCFPLPCLLYWVLTPCIIRNTDHLNAASAQETKMFVEKVIYDPFKRPEAGGKLSLSWESVMIGRRLILIIVRAFVTDPMPRLVIMILLCVLFLLHHALTLPFRDGTANILETISLLSLVFLATVNAFFASFLSLAVSSNDYFKFWWNFCGVVELVIVGAVPLVVCFILAAAVFSQLCRLILVVSVYLRNLWWVCFMWCSNRKETDDTRPLVS